MVLEIGGEERRYNVENEQCEQFWVGQKGRTFTVVAEGKRETATIAYVGEAAPEQGQRLAPAPNRPPPPPVQGYPPPTAYTAPQRPPPPAAVPLDKAVLHAKGFAGRNLSMVKIAVKAAMSLKRDYEAEYQDAMPIELFNLVVTCVMYGSSAAGVTDRLPANLDFRTLAVVKQAAPHPASPPPPPPPPPPTPEQYATPAESVDENMPF